MLGFGFGLTSQITPQASQNSPQASPWRIYGLIISLANFWNLHFNRD